MTPRRILFVIAHPPHRGALAFELLDELLVGAVFDQRVSVLFVGDGVYQLIDWPVETQGNVRARAIARCRHTTSTTFTSTETRDARSRIDADALVLPVRC